MPYFDTMDDEDKNKDAQGSSNEQMISSGQSATLGGQAGGSAPQGTGAAATPTKSGAWTNLTSYIDANKGADEEMGSKVKNTFADTSTGLQGSQSAYKSGADSKIADNTIKDTTSAQLGTDPSKIKIDDFDRQYKASWAGPNAASEVDGWGDIDQGVSKQKTKSGQLDDFSGRQAVLADTYKQPQYNAGEKRLDSFILGTGEGGQRQMQEAKGIAANDDTNWQAMLENINQGITTGKETTGKTAADVQAAFDDSVQKTKNSIDSVDLNAINSERSKQYSDVMSGVASDKPAVREAAYKKLGISAEVGDFLKNSGYSPAQMITMAQKYGLGNVLSTDVQNKFTKLSELGNSVDKNIGNYDFTRNDTGQTGYNVNSGQAKAASEAQAIDKQVEAAYSAEKAKRFSDSARLDQAFSNPSDPLNRQTIINTISSYGVDKKLLNNMIDQGMDISSFMGGGLPDVSKADVLQGSQKTKWDALTKQLGITPDLGKTNQFKFDADGALRELAARIASKNSNPKGNTATYNPQNGTKPY